MTVIALLIGIGFGIWIGVLIGREFAHRDLKARLGVYQNELAKLSQEQYVELGCRLGERIANGDRS